MLVADAGPAGAAPAPAATPCALCGLEAGPRPLTRTFRRETWRFCCHGCAHVYGILLESGMLQPGMSPRDTPLFQRSLELGLVAKPENGDIRDFTESEKSRMSPFSVEAVYHLTGLWCGSCAWLIEQVLGRERGVVSAEVIFASDLLKVRYQPQVLPPDRIPARLAALGYGARTEAEAEAGADREGRDLLLRLGVSAFLWMNVMMLNLAVYVGYFEQTPPSIRHALPFVLMALTLPALGYSAAPILRLAWQGARHGFVRMETLLALGIVSAFGYSVAESLRGGDRIYFDTVCAIVTLVLLGRWLERGAKQKTTRAITLLYRLMPTKARLVVEGDERFVSIDRLLPGQIFLVKAGERIPADGVVVDGRSHVDESVLTGESAPVAKTPGSRVACGAVNVGGVLHVRADRVGGDSTLAQAVQAVEQALGRRARIEQTADRFARAFVPAVMAVAVATCAGWWLAGALPFGSALMRAITVLVIACPCALGIATPLALTAAIGTASRRGILVSDGRVLETIRRVDTVVLDKTGTVTAGTFALLEGDRAHLADLAAIERYSEHPLGSAVVARAAEEGLEVPAATDIEVVKGLGIRGVVGGRLIHIGTRRFVPAPGAALEARAAEAEAAGQTVVFYAWDDEARGVLVFGDRIRDEARAFVRDLAAQGIDVLLVSGDSRGTTARVAADLGIETWHAEVLPADKTGIVAARQQAGHTVAMVGDGVNDAPALARADLGIALGSGTDIAIKAAPVVLMHRDLRRITEVFTLAARTLRIVRQNLFWAFFYNTAAISLAILGVLNPIIAAGGMVVSSLSVIGNSYRLTK